MTLTTHGIVGAAAARAFGWHPLAAFLAAMASHYLLDAIPHWHYHLRSERRDPSNYLNNDIVVDKSFAFDFLKLAFDGCLGFFLSFAIFQPVGEYAIFIVGLGLSAGYCRIFCNLYISRSVASHF